MTMIKSTLQAGQVWRLATLATLLLVPLVVIYILETSFISHIGHCLLVALLLIEMPLSKFTLTLFL
jgi:hypothetical protein